MDNALEKTLAAGGSIWAYGMIFPQHLHWFLSGAKPFVLHCIIYIAVSVIPGLSDTGDVLAEGIDRLLAYSATCCYKTCFSMQYATPSFAKSAMSRH